MSQPFFRDTESAKQNREWAQSKSTFEALVAEIKRLKEIYPEGPPKAQFGELHRLAGMLPPGVYLQDAYAVASGRMGIDEVYSPDLLKSIEMQDS